MREGHAYKRIMVGKRPIEFEVWIAHDLIQLLRYLNEESSFDEIC